MKQKNFNLTVVTKGKLSEDKCVLCVKCHGLFSPRTMNKHAKLCFADSSQSEKSIYTMKNSWMFFASALAMDAKYEEFSEKSFYVC